MNNKISNLTIIICFGIFIVLAIIILNGSNNEIFVNIIIADLSLFETISKLHSIVPNLLNQFLIAVTIFGRELFLPLLFLLIFIFGGKNGRITAVVAGISILILIPLVSIIKDFIERPRPFVPGNDTLMTKPGNFSFPSGHSTIITAGAITALVLFKGNRSTKILPFLLLIDAVLVDFSRIYVGVHYPLDVLGGILLGTGLSLLIINLTAYTRKSKTIIQKRYS